MKLDKHTYEYDTIVIGGGLNAKIYAYYTKCPCIYRDDNAPFRLDICKKSWCRNCKDKTAKTLFRAGKQ